MKTKHMTPKQMRSAITEKFAAIPNKQISAGVYVYIVGYKWVTIIDTRETTTLSKVSLEFFCTVNM